MQTIDESITKNVEYIKAVVPLLPDSMPEQNRTLWAGIAQRVDDAKTLIDEDDKDSERKMICILDATSKYANQITFFLFRQDLLPEDKMVEFRTLVTPEETTAMLEDKEKAIKEEEAELLAKRDAFVARDDSYELVQAVLGGYTIEQARQKQAEYKAKAAKAMGAK